MAVIIQPTQSCLLEIRSWLGTLPLIDVCVVIHPARFPKRRPVTLPAGSANMANLGPPGTSVGGRIVLPPRRSTRSSVACRSSTCAYTETRFFLSFDGPTPPLMLFDPPPVSTTP